MPWRRRRSPLARRLQSPATQTVAASALAAGGALAAAKLLRGRGTADGTAERKRRYRLEPAEPPKAGVTRVARGELDLTIGLLEAAPNGDNGAQAVHEARKSLKRLRALLRVVRPALEDSRYKRENVILRDAGRELSGARDAHVLAETLDSLIASFGKELMPGTWLRLRSELAAGAARAQAESPSAYDAVVDALGNARIRVSNWPLPGENGRATLAEGFERIYRRGRRALRHAHDEPTAENLHELRKRAKDLWHSAQLLEPACPSKLQPLAKSAHRLSDLLGDDHDLCVLLEHARAHPEVIDSVELELLETAAGFRSQSLRRRALACADSLYGRKPKQMLRRLSLG
jgi:CHAD domain-containing protein